MKNLIVLVAFTVFFGLPAFAEKAPVLLSYTIGGIVSSGGIVKTCEVTYDAVEDWVPYVEKAARASEVKIETLFRHISARVPTIEIHAYLPMDDAEPQKILLFEDYSVGRGRKGKEARELIKLAGEKCSDSKDPSGDFKDPLR